MRRSVGREDGAFDRGESAAVFCSKAAGFSRREARQQWVNLNCDELSSSAGMIGDDYPAFYSLNLYAASGQNISPVDVGAGGGWGQSAPN